MAKAIIHILLISLVLLNGMGYTLIQAHFYWDREEITALYCINKDKPEMECDGKCELSKRLSEAKDLPANSEEITLEELQLNFISQNLIELPDRKIIHILENKLKSSVELYQHINSEDFFHPPQG
ncbi:hypothetical protein [Algoriphagus formosus]|uniref:Uncharacterized protein n=1 Tax=Algoriphagus formosus TaxID=2007308 RepID=A0A4V3AQN9_9BACT|nr:hypothetical protein [Algoriphagus aquimaris]TDK43457.1 hypothetical protein E1898_12680 [Algoriphagus aquimaris]